MKEFMQVLRRFVFPYKKYVVLSIVFNVLSALLNIFSFAALIPILQILFKTGDNVNVTTLMEWSDGSIKDVIVNNIYYYINTFITDMGATMTLLFIGLFLIIATLLKTTAYFLAAASVVPIRTGVVREPVPINNIVYKKRASIFWNSIRNRICIRIARSTQRKWQNGQNAIKYCLFLVFINVFHLSTPHTPRRHNSKKEYHRSLCIRQSGYPGGSRKRHPKSSP